MSSVGVIFDTPEGVQQCIGDDATLEQIEAALRSEVEVYSSYLEGDITYYNVQDEETDFHESLRWLRWRPQAVRDRVLRGA